VYERYFGLKRPPFAVTPDPVFLYESASHRHALAALLYGVRERRGFTCLVGEVGTGKSTVIRALLDRLATSVSTILLTHTTVAWGEMLSMILHELGIPTAGLDRVGMLRALNEFVIREFRRRRPPPLLIVDEAQALSKEVLEEIRMLTNLEIADTKLLQVILAGQPELELKLADPALRQLRQRIAVFARLSPLTLEEAQAYVAHRLRVAGCAHASVLFTRDALYLLWKTTGGIPRLMNILCEQGLVYAFGAGKRVVDVALLEEAIRDAGPTFAPSGAGVGRSFWRRSLHRIGVGRYSER
jgi:general secretion pathway protein A